MNVFKIPDSLEKKYKGSGYALAASLGGKLIDIAYVSEIIPDFDDTDPAAFVTDDRLGPKVREFQSLGEVHFGMCSCWEFTEI